MSDYESFTNLNLNSLANNITYERIRPLSGIDRNPSGSVDFTYNTPSNKALVPQASCFMLEFKAAYSRANGVTVPLGQRRLLSRNAGLTIFSSIKSTLNNVQVGISDIVEPSIGKQVEDILFGSKALSHTNLNNGCISLPLAKQLNGRYGTSVLSGTVANVIQDTYNTNLQLIMEMPQEAIHDNTPMDSFDGNYANIVNGSFLTSKNPCVSFKCPIPILSHKQILPSSRLDITFNIASDWRKRLLDIDGIDNTLIGAYDDAAAAGYIGIDLLNFYFCPATITLPNANALVKIPIHIRSRSYDIYKRALTNGTMDTLLLSNQSTINRITVCFVSSKYGSAVPYAGNIGSGSTSPTNFNTLVRGDGAANVLTSNINNMLRSVVIRHNGYQYPSIEYDMKDYTDNALSMSDNLRAYQDLCFEAGWLTSNCGGTLNFEEWQLQKMFSFRMLGADTASSNQTEITLKMDNLINYQNTTCIVITHYNLEFDVELGDDLMTTVKDIRTVTY